MPALPAGSAAIGTVGLTAGSAAIGTVEVTAMPALPAGTNLVGQVEAVGDVAHGAAAAGNPVLLGAEALAAERAVVDAADVSKLVCDLVGKLIVLPYANPENFVSGKTAAIVDTTRTAVIAAQGAGVRLYITQLVVTNGHDTVGTQVSIEDGTTTIASVWAEQMGGGAALTFPTPLRLTANTALNVSCVTTGANVLVSASGYKGA